MALSVQTPDTVGLLRAIESYQPDEEGQAMELAFVEGDELELTGLSAPEGWLHARLDLREGLVPEDYVEALDGDISADEAESVAEGNATDDNGSDADNDNKTRICIEDFIVDVGALNEVTIRVGDLVELVPSDQPDGWVMVTTNEKGEKGLVPEDFLGMPPRDDDMTEEQAALLEAKKKQAELEVKLDEVRRELMHELDSVRKAKDLEIERIQGEKAAEAEAKAAALAELNAFMQKGGAVYVLKDELKSLEDSEARRERLAWVEENQRAAREAAEEAYGGTRSVLGRKKALEAAEAERARAELEFNRVDAARAKAEQALLESQRKVDECAEDLRAEEAAREANERTLMLLPGLKELMAPTQQELRTCLESVTTAVMRNAEQSARLLASMAGASMSTTPHRTPVASSSPRRRMPGGNASKLGTAGAAVGMAAMLGGGTMLLGGGVAGAPVSAGPDGAGKVSMPERMRRVTQSANSVGPSRPKGVKVDGKVQESLFKGKYRSAVTTPDAPSLIQKEVADFTPKARSRPPSLPSSRPTSRPTSRPASRPASRSSITASHQSASRPISPVESSSPRMANTDEVTSHGARAPLDDAVPGYEHEFEWSKAAADTARAARRFSAGEPPVLVETLKWGQQQALAERNLSVERQLQLGKIVAGESAQLLQQHMRAATATMEKKSLPKSVQQIRSLVVAPERRVAERNDSSSSAHVRRNMLAREKAQEKRDTFLNATLSKV